MPLTTSAITSRAAMKGEGAIHSEKWHRCWVKVQGQGHSSSSAAAICTDSIGYDDSVNEEHQTRGRKKQKKTDVASVLKFNKNHEKSTGRFASSGGGGEKAGRKPATRKGAVAPGHPTPDPDVLHGPKDALASLLNGEAVNIAPADVHDFLMKAAELPEGTKKQPDPDLTDVYVEGHLTFGGDGLGIVRDDMPQIPKEYRDQMLTEAKEAGISITYAHQSPLDLKPSQSEISARKVGVKLRDYESGKKKNFPSLLVSKEDDGSGYILDGHHHWGIAAALALETDGIKVPTTRLNVPVKQALAFLNAFVDKHHIPRQGLSAKQDPYMAEEARLAETFTSVLKYNPHHDKAGRFTSGSGGTAGASDTGYQPGSLTKEFLSRMPMGEYKAHETPGWKTLEGGPGKSVGATPTTLEATHAKVFGAVPTNLPFKYSSVEDATVLQTPARAKVQAQAKAILSNYDRADAAGLPRPQFEIYEVPLEGTDLASNAAGIKAYAKALRAQLAPKPIQAAQHAKSHVHGKKNT